MKEIKYIYLSLFESIITYGIIGWGGAYDNVLMQLQKCQNSIIRVATEQDWRYPTKKLYEDFNVLNINNLYIKMSTIYLKKHNQLSPISHEVNTRHAVNNFSLEWPKKTGCRKVYHFLGTQIFNLMPIHLANMPLPAFKKHISRWLQYEYNASKI